ncbi:hypothetical protein BH10BDE1_BH10BDE1_24750 [soil metagenome]
MPKPFFRGSRAQTYAIAVAGLMLVIDFAFSLNHGLAPAVDMAESASLQASITQETASTSTAAAKARVLQRKLERTKTPVPNVRRQDNDLCGIQRESTVTLEGELKIQTVEKPDGARAYWIKASKCPDELYSIVSIDHHNRIDKIIDCQNTNLTELALNSGLQFTIMTVVPSPDVHALALAGSGRLLVNCPDTGLTITRDGFFNRRAGLLKNSEGCVAWTRKDGGRPVRLAHDEHVDEKGCTASGQECFEVLEPDERDVDAFNFKTKNSLSVINPRGLRPVRDAHVYENSVEDLDSSDRSLTGVANWEPIKPTTLPSCP